MRAVFKKRGASHVPGNRNRTGETTCPSEKGRSGNIVTQFKRGRSGNPAGRPLGLTRHIRETTGEGAELVDVMLAVFRGDVTHIPNAKIRSRHRGEIDLRDRIAAATWLADRAFGRPGQVLDDGAPEVAGGYDLSALTLEELKAMRGILGKAARRDVIGAGASGVLAPYPGTSSPGVREPSGAKPGETSPSPRPDPQDSVQTQVRPLAHR